jgi:hypothetical protein
MLDLLFDPEDAGSNPENGGSMFLRNVELLPDYTASPLWEPKTRNIFFWYWELNPSALGKNYVS